MFVVIAVVLASYGFVQLEIHFSNLSFTIELIF